MYGFAKVTTPGASTDTSYFLNVGEILYVKLVEDSNTDSGGIVLATDSDSMGTTVFFKNGTSVLVNETPEELFNSVVFVSAPKFILPEVNTGKQVNWEKLMSDNKNKDRSYTPPPVIADWVSESFNPRNDGWYQDHYREKLIGLRDYLNSIDNLIMHDSKSN